MKLIRLLGETVRYWQRNNGPRRAAALTYYALVSLVSLLILLLSIAGLFFNPERVSQFLFSPVADAIGAENTQFILELVQNYYNPAATVAAGAVSLLLALNSGSSLFLTLEASLNEFLENKQGVMDLPPARRALRAILGRLKAFGFVLGAELLILAGLLATTVLQMADERIAHLVDLPFSAFNWGSRLISAGLAVLMLALVFRFIPHVKMGWRAVFAGAFVSAILLTVLQGLMGAYLAFAGIGSAFGAAGSLVVFLFWVYYSIQVLFFGAAFSKAVNANRHLPGSSDPHPRS